MKPMTLLVVLLALMFPAAGATLPEAQLVTHLKPSPVSKIKPAWQIRLQQHPLVQKLVLKWYQKKLVKKANRLFAAGKPAKRTVATIALVAGILAAISLFALPGLLLIFGLTAIVTGVIGMGKDADKKSRTMAVIGLILGIAAILCLLLAVIYWLSFWITIFQLVLNGSSF